MPLTVAPRQDLSLVVPTLDEAAGITDTLGALAPFRQRGAEIIVVDGGSTDETVSLAAPLVDRVLVADLGRARQQNAGAAIASGEVIAFVHADTKLPPNADSLIRDGLARSGRGWGRFDVRLTGRHPALRVVEHLASLRSRVSGIATGDQAIFVRRELFERVGGFPDIPLMEDVALSRELKRSGPPLCIREPVVTSGRRWETRGVWRTIALMWRLRLEYWLGRDPARIAARYR